MSTCEYCGKTILFGGVRDNGAHFCNQQCRQKAVEQILSNEIPQKVVDQQATEIHKGLCPICNGSGPVDVHLSYRVYSVVFFTSWKTRQNICCRNCARKKQIGDLVFSFLLGWWGFPFGLIITPVQIVRNIFAILRGPDQTWSSNQLRVLVKASIATRLATAN